MPTDRVYYVDNAACPEVGEGTQNDPFCALESVLDLQNTPSGESSVAIVIGHATEVYREHVEFPGAWPRRVAVLGRGRVTIGFTGLAGPVFEVKNGSHLYLHNVTLTRSAESAVRCDDSTVWIDESVLFRNAVGVDAEACELVVRQSQVFDNDGDGIRLSGQSGLRMESSVLVGNGEPKTQTVALRSVESRFDVTYSTIVANDAVLGRGGAGPHASLLCTGGMGGPIRNSVVVGPELASISCPWADFETSFIDTPGLDAPASVVTENWDPTWFEDLESNDAHIRTPESNPWRDLAQWDLGDPQRDLDGALRRAVPGTLGAAGADQP